MKIDSHLSWNSHVHHICIKISKANSILQSLKDFLPSKCLLQLYYALVQPYLNYCTLTWMNTSKTNKLRLQTLQKRAIRSILHQPFREHSQPLFNKLKVLPFHQIIECRVGMYAFKHPSLVKNNHEVHHHNTRSAIKKSSTVSSY